VVVPHQRFDEYALSTSVPEFGDLLPCQFLGPAELHAARFGLRDPIHLPFGPELCLKLRNGPQHMEQQASRGIARIDMLIAHLQVHLLVGHGLGNLAQMQGGTGEPVEARHHERIALPHIVQARAELGPGACRTAVRFLKEFVAVLQLLALDV